MSRARRELDEKTLLYKQEQYRDLLREAESFRLVHPRRDGCSEGRRYYHRALAESVRYLIGWEARLRKRHDEASIFPTWDPEVADTPCR
jgi:hypothetical protein